MSYRFHDTVLDEYHGNLIHVWNLDETSGTRYDGVGSVSLTDVNSVGSIVGKWRKSARFQSAQSESLQYSGDVVRGKSKISLSCWVYFDSLGSEERFLYESTQTAGNARIMVRKLSSNTLDIGMRDSSGAAWDNATSTNAFAADTWYHVLVVFDTVTDKWYAWVNGAEWINVTKSKGAFSDDGTSADGFMLGSGISGGSPYLPLNGYLDEVYMWDEALTVTDAGRLYNSGDGRYATPWSFRDDTLNSYFPDLNHVWVFSEQSGVRADRIGYLDMAQHNSPSGSSDAKKGRSIAFYEFSSQYLSNAQGFSQGKDKISISCWVNPFSDTNETQWILWDDTSTSGYARCGLAITGSMQLYMQQRSTNGVSSSQATSTNTFSTYTWYHIVAVYDTVGDTLKAWVNGTEWINESVSMDAFENGTSANGTRIGDRNNGTIETQFADMLLDELYVFDRALDSADVARLYNNGDGKFLTTEEERAGLDEFTVLLLHMDGTDGSTNFVDSSSSEHSFTAYDNAQIDTTYKKFGTGSGMFDGAGDYISTADSADWDFGYSQKWTVDFWVRFNDFSASQHEYLYTQWEDSSNYVLIQKTDSQTIQLFAADTPAISVNYETEELSLNDDQWYHIAIVRYGTTVKIFIDGVQPTVYEISAIGSGPMPNVAAPLDIGMRASSDYLDGYLDEFRVSKGAARWVNDFTPPVTPYGTEQTEFEVAGTSSFGLANTSEEEQIVNQFFDDFTQASGPLNSKWSDESSAVVVSNQVSFTNTTGGFDADYGYIFPKLRSPNMSVIGYFSGSRAYAANGLFARRVPGGNSYYAIYAHYDGGKTGRLYRKNGASFEHIATSSSWGSTAPSNEKWEMLVFDEGTNVRIIFIVDGTVRLNYLDTNILRVTEGGGAGFRVGESQLSATNTTDNFSVVGVLTGTSLIGFRNSSTVVGDIQVGSTSSMGFNNSSTVVGDVQVSGTSAMGFKGNGTGTSGDVYNESGTSRLGFRAPALTVTKYGDTTGQWDNLLLTGISGGDRLDMTHVYIAGTLDSISLALHADPGTVVCQANIIPAGSMGTITLVEQNSSGISGTIDRVGAATQDPGSYWTVTAWRNNFVEMPVTGINLMGFSNTGSGTIAEEVTEFTPVYIPQTYYRVLNYRRIGEAALMIGYMGD